MSRLGYSIKVLREARLTSARLAAAAALSPTYLSLIEGGERVPPPETLQKIAAGLGVDVGVLETFLPSRQPLARPKLVKQLAEALQRVAEAHDDLKQRLR